MRLTDSAKLLEEWFQELDLDAKLIWLTAIDLCDIAGIWEPNQKLVNYIWKRDLDWPKALAQLAAPFRAQAPRVQVLPDGKLWVTRFVAFQQKGLLNPANNCHAGIIRRLERYGLVEETEGGFFRAKEAALTQVSEAQLCLSPSLAPAEGLARGIGKGKEEEETLKQKEEGTGEKPSATPPPPPAGKPKRARAPSRAELVASFRVAELPFVDEAFGEAWGDWLQYRVVERTDLPPYVPTGVKALLGKLRSLGPARAVAAIRLSIASNWQGIHEGDRNGGNGSGSSSGYGDERELFPEGPKPQNLRRRSDGKPGLEPIPEEERTLPGQGS
jgi:uncharacterized protein YjhX (UPF0386 family)